jgi:hypothetical protein
MIKLVILKSSTTIMIVSMKIKIMNTNKDKKSFFLTFKLYVMELSITPRYCSCVDYVFITFFLCFFLLENDFSNY